KLEIVNGKGEVVRRFASSDKAEVIDTTAIPHPTYWIRPAQRLATTPGYHRCVWDVRHEPPVGSEREFAIAAVYRNTPTGPHGPFVPPGRYTVRLTVDGSVLERALDVRLDPRVTISPADLQLQTDYSLACYNAYLRLQKIRESIDAALQNPAMQRNAKKLEALQALRGSGLLGNPDLLYGSISVAAADKETLVGLQNKFLYLMNVLQSAESRPTQQAIADVRALEEMLETLMKRWEALR
ncbi:MAG: glycoside hydrolase, partial [bacterium]